MKIKKQKKKMKALDNFVCHNEILRSSTTFIHHQLLDDVFIDDVAHKFQKSAPELICKQQGLHDDLFRGEFFALNYFSPNKLIFLSFCFL